MGLRIAFIAILGLILACAILLSILLRLRRDDQVHRFVTVDEDGDPIALGRER